MPSKKIMVASLALAMGMTAFGAVAQTQTQTQNPPPPPPSGQQTQPQPPAQPAPPPSAPAEPYRVVGVQNSLNVRQGPGTNTRVVGQLGPNQKVMVTSRSPDGQWCQIQFGPGGQTGWVSARYLAPAR